MNTDPYIDNENFHRLGFKIKGHEFRQIQNGHSLSMDGGFNATKDSLEIRTCLYRQEPYSAFDVESLYLRLPLDVESGQFGPDEDCIVIFNSDNRKFYSVPEEISFVYTKNTENKIAGTFSMFVTLAPEDGGAPTLVQIKDGVFSIIKSKMTNYDPGAYNYNYCRSPYMEDLRRDKTRYQAFVR